jgi:outer membrane protein assembly factor BamC
MNFVLNHAPKSALLGLCLLLGACSTGPLSGDKIDYKSASTNLPSLEVPPDLTQLSPSTPYTLPGAPVSASDFAQNKAAAAISGVALDALGDVHFKRAGQQRWLVVERPIDELWEPVRNFWQESGFSLALDQPKLGIMETNWAENRAKIPGGFLRNALGGLFDSLFSSGERDKFRTRLERTAAGGTEIFISHRGLAEGYDDDTKVTTAWTARKTDPELETEFLRRLMMRLGGASTAQATVVAPSEVVQTNLVNVVSNQATLEINDELDNAWRRVGFALERSGFTITDRDRKQGLYFIRYASRTKNQPEPGFFSRLFGETKTTAVPLPYGIKLAAQSDRVVLSVQDERGSGDTSETAQRIVGLIADALD